MKYYYVELGDRILDWLYASCPNLLHDEILVEGFLRLVMKEVQNAVREERRRRIETLKNPRTFEMN